MERIKIVYDKEGQTLTVWFDDPRKEHICEETSESEEVILIKDKTGKVISFERLNVVLETKEKGAIPLEAVSI